MAWDFVLEHLTAPTETLVAAGLAALAIYVWVIAASRLLGLRSFAKLSAFDFAMTVAIGSIVAAVALGTASLAAGLLAVAVLFLGQFTVARLRQRGAVGGVVDNQPLLLVRDGQVFDDQLRRARVTEADLRTKLRSANVHRLEDVQAVVFETTGDISILHGETPVSPWLLAGVDDGRSSTATGPPR